MKKLMLIIGNGLSLDLVSKTSQGSKIDLCNLFSKGDCVPWPDGQGTAGFLSFKHCPSLWTLGARSHADNLLAGEIIEDILSCTNVVTKSDKNNSIFTKAYFELASYLKHLFIYYNNLITDDELKKASSNWAWLNLIKRYSLDQECEKITIVSFNYDTFIERLLALNEIDFDVAGFGDARSKIILAKPHGSISFAHEKSQDPSLFRIRSGDEMNEAEIAAFHTVYSSEELGLNYLVNAIIPPYGESNRLAYKWASQTRNSVNEYAQSMGKDDTVILSGLSYSHVDRREIDEIIATLDKDINLYLVNPNPPHALNAILSCRFNNYILYTQPDNIGAIS